MKTHDRKRLMSAVYRYAFAGLAMNYYMFYENLEEYPELDGLIREKEECLAPVLLGFMSGDVSKEQLTEELDTLRCRNRQDMEVLAAYGDSFSIYEYVLNRIERRFVKMDPPSRTTEEFVSLVLDNLSTSDDATILDSRMRSLVSQLPIRYTRQKFYGMVHDRLSVYIGAGQKGIDGLFYMLRTAAMAQQPENMDKAEPELWNFLACLKNENYRNMDSDGYMLCKKSLFDGMELLNKKSDICLLFENVVNNLYAVLLSHDDAMIDTAEDQVFKKILSGLRELFARGEKSMDGALTEALMDLEGIQESAAPRLQFAENEPDADLRKAEKLLSDSPFVDLKEEENDDLPADRQWIDEKAKEFCDQLEKLFAGMPRIVMRAVMASVLSQLPMLFGSVSEFQEYVEGSLLSCTDFAEREACMEIIEKELELES